MTAAAKALSAGDIKEDLTFDLTNRPGDDSYPICGAIWAVCYRDQPAATHKLVVDFLHWVTHEGQESAAERTYAPLPEEFAERVEKKLETIKSVP
jgi:phosphate transport system substrate-binding protein